MQITHPLGQSGSDRRDTVNSRVPPARRSIRN